MKKAATTCLGLAMLLASGALFAQTIFTATLDGSQIVGGGTGSAATGSAVLTLSASGDSLTYSISLVGLDLDGLQTPLDADDDVTAFHLHNAPAGSNGGVVFGLISPAHDSDDIVIDAVAGTLTGIWENTDVNPLSAQLANLLAGELYLNVHTVAFGGARFADRFCCGTFFPMASNSRRRCSFAPHSQYRALVTPAMRGRKKSESDDIQTPAERRASMTWAQRLKRVFNIDIEACPECGGKLRVIA